MPPHHIAGVQVLLRCVAAGTEPGFVDLTDGFTPDAFAAPPTSLRTPPGGRRYTALVPTQLVRLLADDAATDGAGRVRRRPRRRGRQPARPAGPGPRRGRHAWSRPTA